MSILRPSSVLRGPYFFRIRLVPRDWFSNGDNELHRLELFAGNIFPTTTVFLRIIDRQSGISSTGEFLGFVSKSLDGVQGKVENVAGRGSTQRVFGHFGGMRQCSWLAPAPRNVAHSLL